MILFAAMVTLRSGPDALGGMVGITREDDGVVDVDDVVVPVLDPPSEVRGEDVPVSVVPVSKCDDCSIEVDSLPKIVLVDGHEDSVLLREPVEVVVDEPPLGVGPDGLQETKSRPRTRLASTDIAVILLYANLNTPCHKDL